MIVYFMIAIGDTKEARVIFLYLSLLISYLILKLKYIKI